MRLIAALTEPESIRRYLQGVDLPTEPPAEYAAQSPTPAGVGLRRITYYSTLPRSRSLLVGRRTASKSVYPWPLRR